MKSSPLQLNDESKNIRLFPSTTLGTKTAGFYESKDRSELGPHVLRLFELIVVSLQIRLELIITIKIGRHYRNHDNQNQAEVLHSLYISRAKYSVPFKKFVVGDFLTELLERALEARIVNLHRVKGIVGGVDAPKNLF